MKPVPPSATALIAFALAGSMPLGAQSASYTFTDEVEGINNPASVLVGDVAGGLVEIDLATGDFTVEWQAAEGFPFVGPLQFVLNLGNVELGTVTSLSSDYWGSSMLKAFSYSGNAPALTAWQVGDTIATAGGPPEFAEAFTSGVVSLNPLVMPGWNTDTVAFRGLLEGDALPPDDEDPETPEPEPDSDGDGVPDAEDEFPFSDLNPTVILLGVDTGIANNWNGQLVDASGTSLADLIQAMEAEAAATARNHGQYVRVLARGYEGLVYEGWITWAEHGALMRIVARRR